MKIDTIKTKSLKCFVVTDPDGDPISVVNPRSDELSAIVEFIPLFTDFEKAQLFIKETLKETPQKDLVPLLNVNQSFLVVDTKIAES